MKQFEGLLQDVLGEDSQVEPLLGMEARILARVSVTTGTSRPRWTIWAPLAAGAVLLVVLGSRESHKTFGWRHIQPNEVAPKTGKPPALTQDVARSEILTAHLKTHLGKRKKNTGDVEVVNLPHVRAIKIAPLEVAALSLEPLDITALQVIETKER